MMSRYRRAQLAAAGVVLLIAAGILVYRYLDHGPNWDRVAGKVAEAAALRSGMVVADVGAGEGQLAVRMARRVAPGGRVYATELAADRRAAIRQAAEAAGVSKLSVIEAGITTSALAERCCDAIYLRHVYHHLTDADAVTRSLGAALRPGGRLVIIDFLSPRWLFWMHHGLARETVLAQVRAAGFVVERRIDNWSMYEYCLVFRKAA